MDAFLKETILTATSSNELHKVETIQSLWSGYGSIDRYALSGGELRSVVVKHVKMPNGGSHPRGWNTDLSHERKVKSYQVETHFYQNFAHLCDDSARIPHCYDVKFKDDEVIIILEDLDDAGFARRLRSVDINDMKLCLEFLANFHATYLGAIPTGLWDIGTYWHLDTRPEELQVLSDKALKAAAIDIDNVLNNSPFQTFVHGDAKLANFCFSSDKKSVSAVDFQYIGGGCGMKDVAYFVGSCLYEEDCEKLENTLLDIYFTALKKAVIQKEKPVNIADLEANWREMYKYAWADFHRFLKGWSPGHWKINSYSERVSRVVISEIGKRHDIL